MQAHTIDLLSQLLRFYSAADMAMELQVNKSTVNRWMNAVTEPPSYLVDRLNNMLERRLSSNSCNSRQFDFKFIDLFAGLGGFHLAMQKLGGKCLFASELKEDLRKLGLGFRDKRVYETTQKIKQGEIDLNEIAKIKDTNKIREILETLPGVGPKVADCILLFGLKRFEVFPIDVWVRRVMNDLYIKNEDETKVNKKEIENLAKTKYANLAGIAQQYLFYWRRAI